MTPNAELLDHYGLRSTLTNSGEAHENGVAEQAHFSLKDAIDEALMLRGSRDFDSVDDYTGFVRKVVERRNRLVLGKLEQDALICNPCHQPQCRSTSTTGPGCASGAPSRQLAAPTPSLTLGWPTTA